MTHIKKCFISIPLVTSNWNDVRTSENIWHLDPLTGESLERLMTTMTFCKRGDQLSMTSIYGLCQVLWKSQGPDDSVQLSKKKTGGKYQDTVDYLGEWIKYLTVLLWKKNQDTVLRRRAGIGVQIQEVWFKDMSPATVSDLNYYVDKLAQNPICTLHSHLSSLRNTETRTRPHVKLHTTQHILYRYTYTDPSCIKHLSVWPFASIAIPPCL